MAKPLPFWPRKWHFEQLINIIIKKLYVKNSNQIHIFTVHWYLHKEAPYQEQKCSIAEMNITLYLYI